MKQYIKLVKEILEKGSWKPAARENMPRTLGIFGHQFKHNLLEGFPLLTTKEVNFDNITSELRWILRGDTHIKSMIDEGCNIWNEDAYNYYNKVALANEDKNQLYLPTDTEGERFKLMTFTEFVKCIKTTSIEVLERDFSIPGYVLGDCGKQYGYLWRNLPNGGNMIETGVEDNGVKELIFEPTDLDQLKELVYGLITNPFGRRHIISAWNPTTLNQMALPPCHVLVQFNVRELTEEQKLEIATKQKVELISVPNLVLDCSMYQRSADTFLGVPYNIASYSLLTMLLSNMLGMVPGNFIHSFGDAHIYENHISQMSMQVSREPKRLPKLKYSQGMLNLFQQLQTSQFRHPNLKADMIVMALETLEIDDIELSGYQPHPKIKGEVSTGLKK